MVGVPLRLETCERCRETQSLRSPWLGACSFAVRRVACAHGYSVCARGVRVCECVCARQLVRQSEPHLRALPQPMQVEKRVRGGTDGGTKCKERSRKVPILLGVSLPLLPHCCRFSAPHLAGRGGGRSDSGPPQAAEPSGWCGDPLGISEGCVLRLGASPLGRRML